MAVEEQTAWNALLFIQVSRKNGGQKLTIANRVVSKLALRLTKSGSPTGNVVIRILRVSTGEVLATKIWGSASLIPAWTDTVLAEVTFDTPVLINEEVRILVYWPYDEGSNYPQLCYQNTNVKSGEVLTHGNGGWTDNSVWDSTYKYTYEEPTPPAAGGGPAALVAAGII